ncbi:hypothetical protein FNT36_11215 [Hymenobacter setariae]|uniref:TonB-dependent receptor plug domain-containing protein n=1 Tax=Hymenobacter setariae TaxID=2594794 RepID=A0A558BU74_9BACT|nr:hypothetical protein FNT36_11215 [Hymenobacter setariae]
MVNYYLSILLLKASFPAVSQVIPPAASPAPPDTLHSFLRGSLPDSLAPPGTWRVQGQAQPTRPFLTAQDQLRTVAGVQVTPYDGSPGSGQLVRIRGASEGRLSGQPLYIVDGLPALNDELTPDRFLPSVRSEASLPTVAQQQAETGANPLQLLPPEAIEHIEVLAGPAAVARYGPLGANGVISIRTRRASGTAAQPLRVRYAAYAGVQQVRQRYDLLGASEYAAIANEAYLNRGGPASGVPFPNTQLGEGTDWQAAAYRVAGLQQHQLSLEGRTPRTGYLISADYRQQAGVLRNSNLSRYGLRVALDQHPSARLGLRATVALGQTDQHLPLVTGTEGATRAALFALPTVAVRTTQGAYSGYANDNNQYPSYFSNPLAISEYSYSAPRTRRLLSQLAADYQPALGLTVQASVSLQLTQLDAPSFSPRQYINSFGPPEQSDQSGNQAYQNNQLAARLAVHYERRLGQHHRLGAEIDYQYQKNNYSSDSELMLRLYDKANDTPKTGSYAISSISARPRLHRPWARVHYALDSTLEAEVGLSYARFGYDNKAEYYPSAQLSWHPHLQVAGASQPLTLWAGVARTSLFGFGLNMFGPALLTSGGTFPNEEYRRQAPLRTDQLEVGLRLGEPSGRFMAQLVAYERRSYHVLLSSSIALPNASGYVSTVYYDEGMVRNQGLELTVATSWQAGRVQGTTRLAASANRNRLQGNDYAMQRSEEFNNHPLGTFYGFQQDGLTASGSVRYRDLTGDGQVGYQDKRYLGSGIPAQLASLSQQVRLGRLALDAQLDGQFDYKVLNHQLTVLDAPTGLANSATSVRNYWTPTNLSTSVPAPGSVSSYNTEFIWISNRQLENGSHVRLSSLTATYRLRQLASQDLSVWVGVQNLFVLSSYRGYDPNVSSGGSSGNLAGQDYGAVPVPRTWLAGVRLAL